MNPAPQKPSLLIVDDDAALVTLLTGALDDEGYQAAAAHSGTEALEWLENHTPDLMLLDLKMRGLSGRALLRQLQKRGSSVPFLVITGQGDERIAVELMKQGALDYLVKDTSLLDVLPTVVKHALEQIGRDRALAATQAALRDSQQKILAIADHEQQRIGRDLHDSLGQQLTAIEFRLHALQEDFQAPNLAARRADLVRRASELGGLVRETIALTRSLARGLAPVRMGLHGLMDALEELARRSNALGAARCRFECPAPVPLADSHAAVHLFRIAQEAVSNALKHAQAHEIVIKLSLGHRCLLLSIHDDGSGFSPATTTSSGLGLEVMRHRANVLGASLQVQAGAGGGVAVTCSLPLNPHES